MEVRPDVFVGVAVYCVVVFFADVVVDVVVDVTVVVEVVVDVVVDVVVNFVVDVVVNFVVDSITVAVISGVEVNCSFASKVVVLTSFFFPFSVEEVIISSGRMVVTGMEVDI